MQQGVAPTTPSGAAPQPPAARPQTPGQPAPVQQGVAPTAPPAAATQPARTGRGAAAALGGRPQPGAQQGVTVDQVRSQRRERTEGGRLVIEEPGRRTIVREGNTTIIRYDDNERFRRWGAPRFEQRGHEHYAYIARPGGYQVINVTDSHGRLVRRVRRGPDGREIILIDNRRAPGFGTGLGVGLAAGVILGLAAPVITIPRERYIVDVSAAPQPLLYETLEAPPLVAIERPYSLDEVRYNVALRDRMRRVDIDSITFDSGSWEVAPEQQARLEAVAEAIRRVLASRPEEVFLIEGHTDAVGSDVDNLSLSDRRAEAVAVILTDVYQIPPENLVTQGYGEQHPKLPVAGPSRENRRVGVRRVTPLLNGAVTRGPPVGPPADLMIVSRRPRPRMQPALGVGTILVGKTACTTFPAAEKCRVVGSEKFPLGKYPRNACAIARSDLPSNEPPRRQAGSWPIRLLRHPTASTAACWRCGHRRPATGISPTRCWDAPPGSRRRWRSRNRRRR